MSVQCEVLDRQAQPVLSIRTRTPVEGLPQVLGKAYGAVWEYMSQSGESPAGVPFVAYYNMDMQDLDIEIGFPVSRQLAGKDEIQASEIPGGKAATCLFTGPYNELGSAYEQLSAWIKDHGFVASGVVYEFYLNSPQDTPPEELQTQIQFPLIS